MELRDVIGVRHATLRSALAPEALATRLGEEIDGPFNLLGNRPLIGQWNHARASFRRRLGYRNSFQTVMDVAIQPQGSSSVLKVRSYMHPYATAFMILWVLAMVVALVGILRSEAVQAMAASPVLALVPVLMIIVAGAMVFLGRWIARKDHDRMLDTVIGATAAEVLDGQGYRSRAERGEEAAGGWFDARTLVVVATVAVLVIGAAGVVFFAAGRAG